MEKPTIDMPIPEMDLYRHEGHVSIYISVTHWCNLRCPHCYDHFERIGITVDQASHIVQEVERCDFVHPFYDLSGGEVMGVPCWDKLLEVFLGSGQEVQVNTNGTLINDRSIERLVAVNDRYPGQLFLSVSLDSHDPEINRANRPGAGSDNVYAGMELLRKHGVRFRAAITLTSRNRPTITDTVRFIVGNYTREFIIGVLRPVFPMTNNGLGMLLSLTEVQKVKAEVMALQKEIGAFSMYHTLDANGRAFCKAGLDRVHIEPNGDMTSCYALQGPGHVVGNLFREPLRDIVQRMHRIHLDRDQRYLLCEHEERRWGRVPDELKLGLPMAERIGLPVVEGVNE